MEGRDPAGPQRDPASVQADIERAQARLAFAIDELVDRTSPRSVARRGLGRLRDTGENLVEEARALVTGSPVLRRDSRLVEPDEGAILVKGEDEVVADYELRRPPSPALLIGVGVGVAVAVGVAIVLRRRRRR
ncbi:DUF3618 domain-containing protein [Actinorugispora endophytica]|uniref:Uncharacterized protein DUF3618 n=1 Tax=Actinorugispora endophytica TaxID=1605990 RepID=A0A4R6UII4_9ACTN|nr:DUF3618 domain-containing protein [Actinorugispora endophytica]TDQ46621.1 uncharacterized protein DUF3618 [Actinorugispora endophytica]